MLRNGLLRCILDRVQGQAQVMSFRKQKPVQAHIVTDGCKAWASACKARKLNHRAVNHYKMEFVKKDKKPAKGQSKLLGTQKIDRLWQDLKGFLGSKVTSKNNAKEMNPRFKTYVFAYMFRRNADHVWYETGKLCKCREKKESDFRCCPENGRFAMGKL